ncbi:hypothetical protein [Sneathiella glossodoripedis]|uniref:hypothetical protein n=1 Tax=Sneathiella glossodoripedis TaxID=418853 RepID=UPI0004710AC1|nr:hypothetical protein [Sneathiella glossodoripedis]
MIAGISRTRGQWITFFIVFLSTQILGLSGYIEGYYDADGKLDWLTYRWSLSTLAYTVLMLCSWLLLLVVTFKAQDELTVKISASILGSLPTALFCFILLSSLHISEIVYTG